MILIFVFLALGYIGGWLRLRSRSAQPLSAWRAGSFLLGMFLVWVALRSPLVAYDHHLLTVHMIQHLLLMTVAPALILLGEPLVAFWHGLPSVGHVGLGWWHRRPVLQRFAEMLSRPTLCWTASALTLVGWHVPALLTMALKSDVWHSVQQSSFLGSGFLFWWPVVQPWPSDSTGPQWSTLLYLFLATLPCDLLAGFLVFSDRVVYPAYVSMPRHFGFSALEDQQCAGALMWTCVTVVYLVPAAILSTRLLSPRESRRWEAV
jgi:cytochrome c oxidase assembly factor CtaG